ncbi:MAG: response regulator transcription factor [Bacteroidetes bacterium]|nr:response regulator transcription factor [Bacteroidota bacterium]
MILNCVITDDEPVALEILEDYIRMVPELNLVARCKDAIETMTVLRRQRIDVLFIDIQMPEITGMELIKSLKEPPAIVFTTAYPNYAHTGFELDAVDYLLKPISTERFLKTINRLHQRGVGIMSSPTADKKYIFIKIDQDLVKIEFKDILFIEGLENYVKIHCEDRALISYCTLKSIEEVLLQYNFIRIHRSYIVNIDKVDLIQNHIFKIKGHSIAVGKSYRKSISDFFRNYYSVYVAR